MPAEWRYVVPPPHSPTNPTQHSPNHLPSDRATIAIAHSWLTTPGAGPATFLQQILVPRVKADVAGPLGCLTLGSSTSLGLYASHSPALFLHHIVGMPLTRHAQTTWTAKEAVALAPLLSSPYPPIPDGTLDAAIVQLAKLPVEEPLPSSGYPTAALRTIMPALLERRQADGKKLPLEVMDDVLLYYMKMKREDGKNETNFYKLVLQWGVICREELGPEMNAAQWERLEMSENTAAFYLKERRLAGEEV